MKSHRISAVRGAALAVAAFVLFSTLRPGAGSACNCARRLRATRPAPCATCRIRFANFERMVEEMRAENAESRAEMHQLRQDLQATRALLERPAALREAASADSGCDR